MKKIEEVKTQQPAAAQKKNQGFGGMKAGFFSNPPPKKKPVATTPAQPKIEDVSHVKAVPKNERHKIDEVQTALSFDSLEKNKDQWLTPELLQKLMSKPHMMEVL